jgi:hypothetical protein
MRRGLPAGQLPENLVLVAPVGLAVLVEKLVLVAPVRPARSCWSFGPCCPHTPTSLAIFG